MLLGNNLQLEDFLKGIKFERGTIQENTIELTFYLKSKKEISFFLNSRSFIEKLVSSSKTMGYKEVLARFKFVKYSPSEDEQKELLKIQNDFFDELSIQLIGDKFDVFKNMIDYAEENLDKDISPVVDLNINLILLIKVTNYLRDLEIKNIRWIYHKLNLFYINNYETISSIMKGYKISNYIVDCSRRCGLFFGDVDGRNIATPILLKILYGFDGFCFRYCPAPRDKNGKLIGFPGREIWKLNSNTYEFENIENKDYRVNRSLDYENLNTILSKKTIPQNQKIAKLISHFRKD